MDTNNVEISESNKLIENKKIEYGKKFFDYDLVEYYSIEINEEDALKLEDNNNSKINEKKYNLILNYDYPKLLTDLNLTENFSNLGFKKKILNPEKFPELDKIFVEKSEQDGITFACIPVFRDLLIFKKKSKIIGFAKICFDCHQYHIIGTNANIENFGQGSDYEDLGRILESK